jgi:hypothetical protein
MDVAAKQQECLREIIGCAANLRATLQPILDANGHRVHFRPSSSSVAMVGLSAERPQRGEGGFTNLHALAKDFEAEFAKHCGGVEQGRPTPEKALQSFLIREAYTNQRSLVSLVNASGATNEPVDLCFVTDEIALPVATGKIVCDVLALRRDGGRCTPVLLELKTERQLTRLRKQVDDYATLIDAHAGLFAQLYGALLGKEISFDGPSEKWIVWPEAGPGKDPREAELAEVGIRVVSYSKVDGAYTFRVGDRVAPRS